MVGSGGLDGREQALVGDGLRDFEFIGLKAEGAGHAAAAGLDEFDRGAGLAEQRDFAGRATEDRLVMAVAVEENVRAVKTAWDKAGRRWAARKSASSQTCSLRRWARGSLGKSSSSSSLKTLAQLGSRKMNGRPASICGAMRRRTCAR